MKTENGIRIYEVGDIVGTNDYKACRVEFINDKVALLYVYSDDEFKRVDLNKILGIFDGKIKTKEYLDHLKKLDNIIENLEDSFVIENFLMTINDYYSIECNNINIAIEEMIDDVDSELNTLNKIKEELIKYKNQL